MTTVNDTERAYWNGRRKERERCLKIIAGKRHDPMNNGLLVTLYREIEKVPVDELEAILNAPEPKNIQVNPDGSVSKVKRKSQEGKATK